MLCYRLIDKKLRIEVKVGEMKENYQFKEFQKRVSESHSFLTLNLPGIWSSIADSFLSL